MERRPVTKNSAVKAPAQRRNTSGSMFERAGVSNQTTEADSVRIPTGADEASLMVLLGMQWLKDNAPERLVIHLPPSLAPELTADPPLSADYAGHDLRDAVAMMRALRLSLTASGDEVNRLRKTLESIGEYDCPGGLHARHCPGCAACDANKALAQGETK